MLNVYTSPIDHAELVWVPAGNFRMGSSVADIQRLWMDYHWDIKWWEAQVGGAGWIGELLPHQVSLDGFWMYRDPITIGQYYHFM